MSAYQEFLMKKSFVSVAAGFEPDLNGYRLFDFQRDIVRWSCNRGKAAVFADTGLGKQQPVTEPVLTPSGWSVMGELRVGDYVIGSDGLPTKVLGVFPQGVKRVYRLELSDGTFVRAGEDHLWSVRTKVHRYRGDDFVIKTTRDIADSIHRDWQLPMFSPVQVSDSDLPIDPYALGVMLGDGQSSQMTYLCTDNWIGDYLGWRKKANHETCENIGYFAGPLEVMHQVGLIGLRKTSCDKKFVPDMYLNASPSQRLELLNGLMDTDGYPMPDGGSEFSSTSKSLVDAVCDLVRSLGGVARGLRECASTFTYKGECRKGKQAWRVNLKLPNGVPMFKLPRKAEKHVTPEKYPPARIVRAVVDECVDEDQVCILVDAKDSLYVTRDYIVTHNTNIQLTWANEVVKKTGKPVLILAPLAVAEQTAEEARKFGMVASVVAYQNEVTRPQIYITNYEKLEHFDVSVFAGVVLDESSIIKGDGRMRKDIIATFKHTPYRLSCTATPSPNDLMEFGTQSEFLGIMSQTEMLAMFFIHDGGDTSKWRLKGHGRTKFWEWLSTWAVIIRSPRDLGYSADGYDLPELIIHDHVIDSGVTDGLLPYIAQGLSDRLTARRTTLEMRCEKAAEIANGIEGQCLIWCHLNDESDLLCSLVDGAVQVYGSQKPEMKAKHLLGFSHGDVPRLVTKPSIAGYGMNWQNCNHMIFTGLSDSFEQYYQAVRRCWRFGQAKPVHVHVISADSEGAVVANIKRKEQQHHLIGNEMVTHLKEFTLQQLGKARTEKTEYQPIKQMRIPAWLA